ncbi:hypothetical protein KP79_PYT19090 [Mizuhopecten yessoensis]|uniref:Uncharacterized protein n=1 Tax=Mizuhopecten yessoensis TaxID=6573 RepID=A0A210QFZ5_MIZYE|nr:hypothetical protein KP79_PYT19090 [Mizuhopecten yessoensis]
MTEKQDFDNIEKGESTENAPDNSGQKAKPRDLLYAVDEVPPWYLCIILGFQM